MKLEHLLHVAAFGLLAATPCLAEPAAPPEITRAFIEFRALNARLAAPQDCECQTQQLREDIARYADGPLADTLELTRRRICNSGDAATLQALVGVALATADAAADTFTQALAGAFICQPELVEQAVNACEPEQRGPLLDLLSLGFENAIADRPDAAELAGLRTRLHALAAATH